MKEAARRTFLGIGWRFPIGLDGRGGVALEGRESIEQAIHIIISTAPGERIFRPDFGCRIQDLVLAPNNSRIRSLARHYVEESLIRWEPRIRDIRVEAEVSPETPETILLRVSYEERTTNHPGNLVYPFYIRPTAAPPGSSGESEP